MKDIIKKIILEWQEEKFTDVVERNYKLNYLEEINTIIGLRRSGKTYLIYFEIKKLLSNGVDKNQILYINFEDERLEPLKTNELDFIIEAYFELYPESLKKIVYIFFDEIQHLPKWELFINRLHEKKRYKITITGSSSKLLSTEIATELRGRTLETKIYTLNFKEFLNFKNFKLKNNIEFSNDRYQLIKLAGEFLRFGGYPRVILTDLELVKKELIKNYLDMIIFKDIVERYSIRNTHILKIIVNYVLMNYSSCFSINSFIKKFESEYTLNKDTIFSYFSYLEEIGFIYYLQRFTYQVQGRYLIKKLYIADNGFLALTGFKDRLITGPSFENLIFTELIKSKKDIYYFRDEQNNECDFIVSEENKIREAIQVTLELNTKNEKREIQGLVSALSKLNLTCGTIITKDHEKTIKINSFKLKVIPFWKWLINEAC